MTFIRLLFGIFATFFFLSGCSTTSYVSQREYAYALQQQQQARRNAEIERQRMMREYIRRIQTQAE